ncbi:interleukin-20 receptor subunit alpha isoform X3 [Ochotona curzoniae]|uniref:interleukin-20 receptor subunit alpha isoform X3 n=1 Tax=Ochotona curzoniae TaxID=130825 RepID=UPI001B34E06E|nr:interleukin-20 receptor subunit alpha isoform X3 [Ochotona curzoniae]
MKNVLQWNPPEGLHGVDVTYSVQYFIYGQKRWLNKSECRNISRTYCDLSAETSDYEHQYYAKVKAIWETNCSKWAETGRFYPFLETQIGPPGVTLIPEEKSISIILTAPEKWKKNPEDSPVSMQQIYSNLKYNVSVYNTKSKRMWFQYVTNHTVELTWLEPATLYCVHVESFVSGPLRPTQPSEEQCISTLEDQTSALKVKIIFWYVLPICVVVFLVSVMGYSIYRYIHVGKEKHPANLILIYRNQFDKRFFVPAEKIMINFITFNILDDSKAPQKDVSFVEEGRDGSDVLDLGSGKLLQPLEEEAEVKHLGYASHVVELVCDSGDSPRDPVFIQQESLSGTTPTDQTVTMCEEDVQNDTEWEPGDQEGSTQKEASIPETSLEPQANSDPQTFLHSYTPQLRDLQYLAQARRDSEEGPEEEPSITLVDWDPHTGRLYIPSLPSFDQEPESWEHAECAQPMEESLLSRLMEKQAPDDKPLEESKTYLMQFMEEWGLYVQMGN